MMFGCRIRRVSLYAGDEWIHPLIEGRAFGLDPETATKYADSLIEHCADRRLYPIDDEARALISGVPYTCEPPVLCAPTEPHHEAVPMQVGDE